MSSNPPLYSYIGKRSKDLLTKDYNFYHKFTVSMLSSSGMGITATGLKRDRFFIGDISTSYITGNTVVDVKVDTKSNMSTKVTLNGIMPRTKVAFSFKVPDHKSGKMFTKVILNGIMPHTKVAFSFKVPDHKSGKLDMQYSHRHASIDSSIGLNPSPQLELSAAIGSGDLSLGSEVGFDTASASFTKYNAGISLNKPDFSASLLLLEKGRALKASYYHSVNSFHSVAAEMTHRFPTYENSFTIGSSHVVNALTVVKTRYSDNGKAAVLCQHEWRPKSLITISAEYDSKAVNAAPSKMGVSLALKP